MANEWTPETGFGDEELAKNSESYPRAGVGVFKKHFFPIFRLISLIFIEKGREMIWD